MGEKAIKGFYQHYKQLRKVSDQNKFTQQQPSVYTKFMEAIVDKQQLPCRVGLVKQMGKADEIDIQG